MKYRAQELLVKDFEASAKTSGFTFTETGGGAVHRVKTFQSDAVDMQGKSSVVFACKGGLSATQGVWSLQGAIASTGTFVSLESATDNNTTTVFTVSSPVFQFYRVQYVLKEIVVGGAAYDALTALDFVIQSTR